MLYVRHTLEETGDYGRHVRPQTRLDVFCNHPAAVFGAEDDVDVNSGKGAGHNRLRPLRGGLSNSTPLGLLPGKSTVEARGPRWMRDEIEYG